ncbi:MAG: MFS transporter [Acidimicrobiales bacterium]
MTLVAFVTNVDGTIVIIGLPRLMSGLHISVTTGLWTLTSYIITSTVLLLPAGRWSDVVGSRRIFLSGLAVFTVATVGCGLAVSGGTLVAARFVQGAGAALAMATATPLIVRVFPGHELGRALGINSTAWVMGSIVGPVVGGALVGAFGWRSIFFVTVPFALAGVAGGLLFLPGGPGAGARQRRAAASRERPDWGGLASFTCALVALLVALSEGPPWGWTSWRVVGLLAAAAALVAFFGWWELRLDHPLFDLRLLRHPHFRAGLGYTLSYATGFFATTFLLTFYLQGALSLSPLEAGLVLVPLSAPQLVLAPIGGVLADRFGPARLVMGGTVLLVVSAYLLGEQGTTLSLRAVVVPLVIMSVGNSLLWPALVKAVMSAAPSDRSGVAAGLFYTLRNVGMSLSLTLALVVVEASLPGSMASRVFVGSAGVLPAREAGALAHSIDTGFRFFIAFYAIALLISLGLLAARRRATEGAPAPEIGA